jgi:hypothetical protein
MSALRDSGGGCAISKWEWRNEPEVEQWREAEAVRLLQEVGAVVTFFESEGVRIPSREIFHARIVEAYDAKDMVAYREAVNGYEQVTREAYRQLSRRGKGPGGGVSAVLPCLLRLGASGVALVAAT